MITSYTASLRPSCRIFKQLTSDGFNDFALDHANQFLCNFVANGLLARAFLLATFLEKAIADIFECFAPATAVAVCGAVEVFFSTSSKKYTIKPSRPLYAGRI